jgi:hypothetical protein
MKKQTKKIIKWIVIIALILVAVFLVYSFFFGKDLTSCLVGLASITCQEEGSTLKSLSYMKVAVGLLPPTVTCVDNSIIKLTKEDIKLCKDNPDSLFELI